jgi:putative membrane protein
VNDWHRLSPRMLVIHPVQHLIQALPALIGLLIAGSTQGQGALWGVALAVLMVALGVLRWFTTTYRIGAEQVQVRRGLLRRRVLSVPRDRIRTVDVTAPAMHRVLGMARVTIGTGLADTRKHDGLVLDALDAPAAATLRDRLLHRQPAAAQPEPDTAPVADQVLARLSTRWVGYGPFTLSGLVTVGVVAAFLSRVVQEAHVDPARSATTRHLAEQLLRTPLPVLLAELVVALLVVAGLASTCGYLLAFWNFRLTRRPGGTLHVTRGLVTTRATTIEERRLRGVELSEPLLLRAVRGARCIAIATGLRVGRGAERGGSLLLPPAPRAEALRVGAAVLGGTALVGTALGTASGGTAPDGAEPLTTPLRRHGPRAAQRRYTRALVPVALLSAVLAVLWWWTPVPAWLPATAAVLLVPAALLATDRYASLGHALVSGALVTRRGCLVRRRAVLPAPGIIGWNVRRSFFQRRAGLATLTATTAGGEQAYPVQDVPLAEAVALADAVSPGLLTPLLVEGVESAGVVRRRGVGTKRP